MAGNEEARGWCIADCGARNNKQQSVFVHKLDLLFIICFYGERIMKYAGRAS